MKRTITTLSALLFAGACMAAAPGDSANLSDNDLSTRMVMPASDASAVFESAGTPVLCYKVYSSGESYFLDPAGWVLSGSNDGKRWKEIDRQRGVAFCARFQEKLCLLPTPAQYKQYKLTFLPSGKCESIAVGEVRFLDNDPEKVWGGFSYPSVNFMVKSPETKGAQMYGYMVQEIDEFVKYHARKVAEILFWKPEEQNHEVNRINYVLRNFDGVAYKTGGGDMVEINFSTSHIERSIAESLYKLDFEARGVLYHELTHGYQYVPKGCGGYGDSKVAWSCIEGMADAVRAQTGHFDLSTRRPGGNWLDGYRTTGFFIQWMTFTDPDAIRKFHATVRDLDVWSWDAAIKSLYGPGASIESKWEEYQQWLKANQTKK